MEISDLKIGDLYAAEYTVIANTISNEGYYPVTEAIEILPSDIFMIIGFCEIDEINSLDVEILFEGRKMWFTFHRRDCMIENVRRAESYDIPFMTLNEDEPGSNSTSLIDTYSPTPLKIKGCFSHFLSNLVVLQPYVCS